MTKPTENSDQLKNTSFQQNSALVDLLLRLFIVLVFKRALCVIIVLQRKVDKSLSKPVMTKMRCWTIVHLHNTSLLNNQARAVWPKLCRRLFQTHFSVWKTVRRTSRQTDGQTGRQTNSLGEFTLTHIKHCHKTARTYSISNIHFKILREDIL